MILQDKKVRERARLLLDKRLKILKEIQIHTRNIEEAIRKKDTSEILKWLELRGKAISDFDEITKNMAGMVKEKDDIVEEIKRDGELGVFYEEAVALLKEIKKQDDKNLKDARELQLHISNSINDARQAGKALKGYGVIEGRSGFGGFIDTKK